MEVILLQRVERLGIIGDVVRVKPGFARNFLLPQGKALRATKENMTHFEKQKATIEADNIKHRDEAQKIASKLDGTVLTVIRQAGQSAQLYGSVSAKDISDAFKATKVEVSRQQVRIDHPIKMLGLHEINIFLHPEVHIKVTVNVAQSEDEATAQLKAAQEEAAGLEAQAEAEAAFKKSSKKAKAEVAEPDVEAAAETAVEAEAPKKKTSKKAEASEAEAEEEAPKKKTSKKAEASEAEAEEEAPKKAAKKAKTAKKDESENEEE